MLKVSNLRELTREEVVQRKLDLEEELFNLRMRRSLKQLDNPLRLREVGREIARVLTVLNEDKLGIRKLAEEKVTVLASQTKDKGKKD